MLREMAFTGSFYPSSAKKTGEMLGGFFSAARNGTAAGKNRIVIAPHAGYVYSGKTAAHSYSALQKASCCIILSPNHTGLGEKISIFPKGEWESLFGNVKVDEKVASKIAEEIGVERDELAHIGEHSIEVQIPFLSHAFGNCFTIVPITMMEHKLEKLEELGKIIGKIMKEKNRKEDGGEICLIASSDFTHYKSEKEARKTDSEAIRFIEELDYRGFHRFASKENSSICGYAPITAAIAAARETGAKKARLLHYETSANATGDESSVVGYAAIGME